MTKNNLNDNEELNVTIWASVAILFGLFITDISVVTIPHQDRITSDVSIIISLSMIVWLFVILSFVYSKYKTNLKLKDEV